MPRALLCALLLAVSTLVAAGCTRAPQEPVKVEPKKDRIPPIEENR